MAVKGFARAGGIDVRNRGQFAKFDLRKLEALVARVNGIVGASLNYGSVGSKGKAPHPNAEGLSVASVLAIHEYGSGHIPERSVIRWVGKAKQREIQRAFSEAVRAYIAGRMSFDAMAEHVGERIVELMRERIRNRIPPPLAERTKANPDRDPRYIPLLDTESIHDSLGFEVKR